MGNDWISFIDNLNENDRVNLIQQTDDENINVRNAFYGVELKYLV